jgi:crotonobetainyl-CoA:carnitine CoA-transferase CaiB-like acyl-CoA transferase
MTDSKPLEGIRILAIEQLMALPFCTQLLADFGAQVVSVESIGYGSYESSRWRERTGRHKERIQVKLNDARGQELLRRLAGSVDVVAENFRPGVMDKYGLGWADMQKVNPALIYVSISGFGHPDFLASPLWGQAAYGPIGEAMSGAMHAIRGQGGLASGMALGDIVSALFATSGILVALRQRDRTGVGQYLDVSMADSLFALAELPFIKHSLSAVVPPRPDDRPAGRSSFVDYPSGVFAASDGEIQLIMMNDLHWEALCRVLGHEEWIEDAGFNDPGVRPSLIRDVVLPVFDSWVLARTKVQAAGVLQEAGIAAAPINGPADIEDHPHFRARHMIETVEIEDGLQIKVAGNPIKLSAVEASRDTGGPRLRIARPGEHTRSVLEQDFGLTGEEIAEFEEQGVILDTSAQVVG